MRIKKIEMVGFKSFCDKTPFVFADNLTAIVGPNGCGKSNVVDAMRWVMGSKSAKQLRGLTMESVIFAGTEARGPLGMAEVTFVLDLSDGVVPPQYSGYREVEVTRRLFRDGTSEYAIQKVPARLQDIRDLFLGTGVGHYAYAIIEQGRVGEIVSSRPETRRQFIEEAAGITKYKDKKHKAELKMASTRHNLLRIGDIVAELDSSMRRLWRAAKKAERFEAYRDEVADLERWRISGRLLGNLNARRVAERSLGDLSLGVTQADAHIAHQEATLAAGRLELRELEVALSDRQAELANVDNRVKLLEAQLDHKRSEIGQLGRRADLDAAEAERLEEAIGRYQVELEETREALKAVEAEYEERKALLATREQDLDEVRDSQADVDERVESYRGRSSRVDTRLATLDVDRRSAAQRVEEASERRDQLHGILEGLRDRLHELEPRVVELSARLEAGRAENEERRVRREEASTRHRQLLEQVSRLEVELDTVRGQLHRSKSRQGSLEEIQRRYEGFQQGTRAIMEHAGELGSAEAIRGVLADVVDTPAEYEAAVEAVLGERLGAILVEDQQVSVGAVSYLKAGQLGRSCFLPLNGTSESFGAHGMASGAASLGFESGGDNEILDPSVRGRILDLVQVQGQYQGVADRLLGDVVVVGSLEDALRVWRAQKAPRTVVTLEGEVVDPLGLVSGGSSGAAGGGVLAQKREIRELVEICEDLQRHHDELHERLVATKQEVRSVEEELEDLRRIIHLAEMDILADSKDLESARTQISEHRQRLGAHEAELASIEELLENLTSRQAEWHRESDSLVTEQASAQEQLQLGLTEAERARGRVAQLAGETAELRVNVARSAEQQNTRQRDIARLLKDMETARERLEGLAQSAAQSRERVIVLEQEVADGDAERLQFSSVAMDLGERVAEEGSVCAAHRLALDEKEAGLRALREERRSQAEEREDLRLRLLELDKDWEHLAERLAERHRVSPEDVLHDYHLRPLFDDELVAHLDKQSRILESLRSTYNPGARQELEELSERHTFLVAQKQDLEDALDRLEKAIQKINKTSRARFREAFEGINAEFQSVFPRLFKGGKARLEISQSGDILNAGVDIVAQPPGKKLQSVDIMSGGEKALTAVALLFAIFRYKPSPFCLLDEVDAPLDDVNVERFNELVREMAEDTQFVMITHNKRTMALADSLYGVTMDPPGCSRVVRVSFKEASRMVDQAPPAAGGGGSGLVGSMPVAGAVASGGSVATESATASSSAN